MGIERALWIAGGAGGIAEPRGGLFGEIGPIAGGRVAREQLFVAEIITFWHMGAVGHHHDLEALGPVRALRFDNGHERCVDKENAILGVVDDIGHLLFGKARVDRVANRTDAGDGVVKLKMAVTVPSQRRYAVAYIYAKRFERVRQLGHTLKCFNVVGFVNIAFRAHGDDLSGWVHLGGICQDVRDFQRTHHHRTQHVRPSPAF